MGLARMRLATIPILRGVTFMSNAYSADTQQLGLPKFLIHKSKLCYLSEEELQSIKGSPWRRLAHGDEVGMHS